MQRSGSDINRGWRGRGTLVGRECVTDLWWGEVVCNSNMSVLPSFYLGIQRLESLALRGTLAGRKVRAGLCYNGNGRVKR